MHHSLALVALSSGYMVLDKSLCIAYWLCWAVSNVDIAGSSGLAVDVWLLQLLQGSPGCQKVPIYFYIGSSTITIESSPRQTGFMVAC